MTRDEAGRLDLGLIQQGRPIRPFAELSRGRLSRRDGCLARLIGVSRPGHTLTAPPLPEASVSLIEVPALAISSSDIRARVAAGRPIRYLVPDGVDHYIAKTGLYRDDV